MSQNSKRLLTSILIIVLIIAAGTYLYLKYPQTKSTGETTLIKANVYENTKYGFNFGMPEDANVEEISTTSAEDLIQVQVSNPEFKIDILVNPKINTFSAVKWHSYKQYETVQIGSTGADIYYGQLDSASSSRFFIGQIRIGTNSYVIESYTNSDNLSEKENVFKNLISSLKFNEGCVVLPYKGSVPSSQTYIDIRGGMTCKYLISSDQPLYTFNLLPSDYDTIAGIDVIKEGVKIQHIAMDNKAEGPYMVEPPTSTDFFHSLDINFDGYNDIEIDTCFGATGNVCKTYFLFNPQTGQFDYSEDFSKLSGVPDPDTKTILTHGNSCVDCNYDAVYKVVNNKPVLIKGIDSEHGVVVTTELKDGVYVTSTSTEKTY